MGVRDILITLVAYVFRSMEMHGEITPGSYILDRKGNALDGGLPPLTFDTFIKHLDRVGAQHNDLFKNRLDTHVGGEREFFPQGEFKLSELLPIGKKADKALQEHFHKNDMIRYAWRYIGCFFGDDSVRSAYPYIGILRVKVAMMYVGIQDGMRAKLDAVCLPSNGDSIEYLSRHFFALHHDSSASYCKIEKALAKLTVASARDPWRYVSKLLGYLTTDWRTPVVGAYLQAVCSMYGLTVMTHNDTNKVLFDREVVVTNHDGIEIDHPYGDPDKLESGLREADPAVMRLFTTDRDLYYKLLNGSYPWVRGDTEMAYEHAAYTLGVSSVDLQLFDENLRQQSTWSGIKSCSLPGTLSEFSPCAYWPEHSCNKWLDVLEPLTVGVCSYGRRHPDDAPNTTRTYPFSTMLFGLSPQMIDFDDPAQVEKLQQYVASCSGCTPPKSNAFPRELVKMTNASQVPEQLSNLFGLDHHLQRNVKQEQGDNVSPPTNTKSKSSQDMTSQDQKLANTNSKTKAKKPQNKKQKL